MGKRKAAGKKKRRKRALPTAAVGIPVEEKKPGLAARVEAALARWRSRFVGPPEPPLRTRAPTIEQRTGVLHEEVVRFKGRIEVTRNGCDDCCVLISKAELDSLEQALAILSDTDGVKAMSSQIAQLAATVEGAPAGV